MNRRSGLTFIELIVVILIIGLVMAMGMPSFVNMMRSTKVGIAARQLAGYMKYVQDKAVRGNKEFNMVFDLTLDQYWATKEVSEEELPPEYYYSTEYDQMKMRYPVYEDQYIGLVDLSPEVKLASIKDENDMEYTQDYFFVVFYPDGTATRSTIYLTGPKDDIMTVNIKPYNGEAVVYDGYEEISPLPQLEDEEE